MTAPVSDETSRMKRIIAATAAAFLLGAAPVVAHAATEAPAVEPADASTLGWVRIDEYETHAECKAAGEQLIGAYYTKYRCEPDEDEVQQVFGWILMAWVPDSSPPRH
jgi:hypothetical protein